MAKSNSKERFTDDPHFEVVEDTDQIDRDSDEYFEGRLAAKRGDERDEDQLFNWLLGYDEYTAEHA